MALSCKLRQEVLHFIINRMAQRKLPIPQRGNLRRLLCREEPLNAAPQPIARLAVTRIRLIFYPFQAMSQCIGADICLAPAQ